MQSKKGQGIVEFAVVLAIVAVCVLLILEFVGPRVGNVFSNLLGTL